MLWDSSEVINVYLGSRAAALVRGTASTTFTFVPDWREGLAAIGNSAASVPKRSAVAMWLSGGLSRPFLLPVVNGLSSKAERYEVARASAQLATGLEGPCTVWVDDGPLDSPVVCVAIDKSVLDAVNNSILTHWPRKSRLSTIRPWWSECLRHAVRGKSSVNTVVVQDCDSLTLLSAEGAQFNMAMTAWPIVDKASGDATLARLRVSSSFDTGVIRKYLLQTDQASHSRSNDDFALGGMSEVYE